jgi:dolichol-phosphate mannosyltransferase
LDPTASSPPALTVVIPTFNERDNIPHVIDRIAKTLAGVSWQAIVVDDDSPDGTAAVVKAIARADPRVACLHRIGRRGLAGAVLEGIMASAAPYVAVIDGDMQHDESLLPRMLAVLGADGSDLVIGSRYLDDAGLARGLSARRKAGSEFATWLAQRVLKAEVSDPVSGFFMIRREVVEAVAPHLSGQGFKILFDIIASQPRPLKIVELPYAFTERAAGESKLDLRIVVEYLGLILTKATGNLVPPRALLFGLVGASGLIVHLGVLRLLLGAGLPFAGAQAIAAVTAMTTNYLINNAVTYRDRRLRGLAFVTGYLRFCALCAVGLLANVAVGDLVHQHTSVWWLAGAAGAAFGAVWNYVSTALAVW